MPVSFFDGPFALERIDCEAIVFEMTDNGDMELKVSLLHE
jgi:hypothetical protein